MCQTSTKIPKIAIQKSVHLYESIKFRSAFFDMPSGYYLG